MRILANENFPFDAVEALRGDGHDVAWIHSDAPGSKDEEVLRMAMADSRILITFDKDFGDLAFRAGLPATCGIILFRLQASSSALLAAHVVAAIRSRDEWLGHFSVVEAARIRIRPLPAVDP
jgi:predicted nuclease of predicted toxin-antitoxin system